jgi:alkanesulfonate monooxygenase SsuD/methylene tetrahydromethanopterin reductase-like flavin-dependent oxidoreductase (luciferase family)
VRRKADPEEETMKFGVFDHVDDSGLPLSMLGMGRGISPIEAGFYGIPSSEMQARYFEASDLILKALQSETLTHQGKYYSFTNVPMTLRPIQRPHPELWYATRTKESFAWAGKVGVNTVTLASGSSRHSQG